MYVSLIFAVQYEPALRFMNLCGLQWSHSFHLFLPSSSALWLVSSGRPLRSVDTLVTSSRKMTIPRNGGPFIWSAAGLWRSKVSLGHYVSLYSSLLYPPFSRHFTNWILPLVFLYTMMLLGTIVYMFKFVRRATPGGFYGSPTRLLA